MQHFTRRETVILTRTSAARLTYLARTGVVVPLSEDSAAKQLYYTWEQILELRAIRHLRRQVSLQMIRKILAFLEGTAGDRALHDKHLIISNGEVSWLQPQENMEPQVVQVAAKANRHVGQLKLMTLPSLINFADEVWETARNSKVIDFESFRQRVVPFRPR
ncbi:MAG: MerR family transcriptional regulator [Cyanobacteria bacterium P01_C01_bin.120]